MSDSRKNIKLDSEVFQRLEELKPEDVTWNQFARSLADAYEESDSESSPESEDLASRLESIEILLESVPRDTAQEIESRFG